MSYNGWTNYETWAVKLWIDNEEGSYNYWREATRTAWDEAEYKGNRFSDDREARARMLLVEQLKSEYEEAMPDVEGVWADLLGAALSEVDWYEIAQSMLDEARENDDLDEGEPDEESDEESDEPADAPTTT